MGQRPGGSFTGNRMAKAMGEAIMPGDEKRKAAPIVHARVAGGRSGCS